MNAKKLIPQQHDPAHASEDFVVGRITVIRGARIMLDADLAELYGVETRRLNEQVRRNCAKFPADFIFQLTGDEFKNLKSQFATSSWGGTRNLMQAIKSLMTPPAPKKRPIGFTVDIEGGGK